LLSASQTIPGQRRQDAAESQTDRRGAEPLRRLVERGRAAVVQPIYVALALLALAGSAVIVALRARDAARRRAAEADERVRVLFAVFDAAPAATVLLGETGRVVLTNRAACDYFANGAALEGENFLKLLGNAPAPFRDAMVADDDALFTVGDGEA